MRKNIPQELLQQKRWLPCNAKKVPVIKAWTKPENQMTFAAVAAKSKYAGFDTTGHGIATDYALFDFDHVLDDNGEFVNDDAQNWFQSIIQQLNCYAERSISGHGVHIIAAPTAGKFAPIANGKKKGILYFDSDNDIKLEVFYKTRGRYCLMTGNLFATDSLDIAHGAVVDEVFQHILDEIQMKLREADNSARQGSLNLNAAGYDDVEAKTPTDSDRDNELAELAELEAAEIAECREENFDNGDAPIAEKSARQTGFYSAYDGSYDLFRAPLMLKGINPVALADSDWLAVISACKNIGVPYSVVDAFNKRDPNRYDAVENQRRWDSCTDPNFGIETLHGIAKRFGVYSEKNAWHKFYGNGKTPAQNSATVTETAENDSATVINSAAAPTVEEISTGDFDLDDDIRAQLEIWQEENGNINPAVIKEIFDAAAYVSKLNTDNFKREDADDLVVRRKIALLKYYAPKFASKFFDFLRGVKVTNVRDIEREFDKGKRRVEAKQKDFWHEQAAADAEKKRNARALAVSNNIEELQRLRDEPPSTDRDNKMRDLIRETVDWQLDRHGDRVAVKSNAANLHTIFTFDPVLDGLFGYEQFVEADVFLKTPPWSPEKQRGDEWNDRDDAQLRMYLRTNYTDFTGKDLILDGVTQYSDKRAFHPIKDYFRNLPTWDKQLRAERIFCKYLGAEDNAFNREVTLNWLTAAVARIFHSGCNYQLCPILKGAQGIGKSFIIETLGGKWYSALNHDVNSEQAFEVLRNSWLCEFKELKAMRKADVNSVKSFIDTAADNRREKYGRRAKIFKRHCVTIATTNDEQFLSDVTGNRRFPIIECFNPRGQHGEQPTPEEIAQIWAEVFHRYCEMFNGKFDAAGVFSDEFDDHKLNLSEAAKPIVEELAEQHMRDDGLKGEVQSFLDKPIPAAVIWNLLTKDERRKFFADEKITIEHDALHARFYPANKNRQPAEELRAAYEAAIAPSNFVKQCSIRTPFGDVDALTFYGTEQRQHICAAEILNEAFANSDRRVSMRRIIEVLSQLDGWTKGKRIKSYSAYGDQRNIFYRDADNQPTEPPADNTDYDFGGEPIDNFDVPDFKEDKEGR